MTIRVSFQPYRGDDPFIFISYAHVDMDRVESDFERLNRAGYRLWYDDAIRPGSEWADDIAVALTGAAAVLVFISPAAVESTNVRNEINFALNRRKPLFAVYLEDLTLPPGLALRMGDIQAILKWRLEADEYWNRIFTALPAAARALLDYHVQWSNIISPARFAPLRAIIPVGREILLLNSGAPDVWVYALRRDGGDCLWRVYRRDERKVLQKVGWDRDYLYLTGEVTVEPDLQFVEKYWLREGDQLTSFSWYEVPAYSRQKYDKVPEWDSIDWIEVSQLQKIGARNTPGQSVRAARGGEQLEYEIGGQLGIWSAPNDKIVGAEVQRDGTLVVALRSGRVCLLGRDDKD